jgi:hypothetical protein
VKTDEPKKSYLILYVESERVAKKNGKSPASSYSRRWYYYEHCPNLKIEDSAGKNS